MQSQLIIGKIAYINTSINPENGFPLTRCEHPNITNTPEIQMTLKCCEGQECLHITGLNVLCQPKTLIKTLSSILLKKNKILETKLFTSFHFISSKKTQKYL